MSTDQLTLLKVLLDAERLQLLGLLAQGPQTAAALHVALDLQDYALTKHLHKLQESGLVQQENADYVLDQKQLNALKRELFASATPKAATLSETERTLQGYLTKDGKLKTIPAKFEKKKVILAWLVEKFDPNTRYPERELSQLLAAYHPDYADLRRSLVDLGYMQREDGMYWRV